MPEAIVASLTAEDPEAVTIPTCLPIGTDAKHFARLGINCYGFVPLQLPSAFDFPAMFHGADERVPVSALSFGQRVLHNFFARCWHHVGGALASREASRAGRVRLECWARLIPSEAPTCPLATPASAPDMRLGYVVGAAPLPGVTKQACDLKIRAVRGEVSWSRRGDSNP